MGLFSFSKASVTIAISSLIFVGASFGCEEHPFYNAYTLTADDCTLLDRIEGLVDKVQTTRLIEIEQNIQHMIDNNTTFSPRVTFMLLSIKLIVSEKFRVAPPSVVDWNIVDDLVRGYNIFPNKTTMMNDGVFIDTYTSNNGLIIQILYDASSTQQARDKCYEKHDLITTNLECRFKYGPSTIIIRNNINKILPIEDDYRNFSMVDFENRVLIDPCDRGCFPPYDEGSPMRIGYTLEPHGGLSNAYYDREKIDPAHYPSLYGRITVYEVYTYLLDIGQGFGFFSNDIGLLKDLSDKMKDGYFNRSNVFGEELLSSSLTHVVV